MAGLRFDPAAHIRQLTQLHNRQMYALETYGKAAGGRMVRYAKANRPWADRSHMARNTISSSTAWMAGRLRISLHGGMSYDIYLEFVRFRRKGRLAIWFPTVRKLSPEIISAWADRMKEG